MQGKQSVERILFGYDKDGLLLCMYVHRVGVHMAVLLYSVARLTLYSEEVILRVFRHFFKDEKHLLLEIFKQ